MEQQQEDPGRRGRAGRRRVDGQLGRAGPGPCPGHGQVLGRRRARENDCANAAGTHSCAGMSTEGLLRRRLEAGGRRQLRGDGRPAGGLRRLQRTADQPGLTRRGGPAGDPDDDRHPRSRPRRAGPTSTGVRSPPRFRPRAGIGPPASACAAFPVRPASPGRLGRDPFGELPLRRRPPGWRRWRRSAGTSRSAATVSGCRSVPRKGWTPTTWPRSGACSIGSSPALVSEHVAWRRRRRHLSERPPAVALHRGGAGRPLPQHRPRPGGLRPADPGREPLDLRRLRPVDAAGMGVPGRGRAQDRLRSSCSTSTTSTSAPPTTASTPTPTWTPSLSTPWRRSTSPATWSGGSGTRPC